MSCSILRLRWTADAAYLYRSEMEPPEVGDFNAWHRVNEAADFMFGLMSLWGNLPAVETLVAGRLRRLPSANAQASVASGALGLATQAAIRAEEGRIQEERRKSLAEEDT